MMLGCGDGGRQGVSISAKDAAAGKDPWKRGSGH